VVYQDLHLDQAASQAPDACRPAFTGCGPSLAGCSRTLLFVHTPPWWCFHTGPGGAPPGLLPFGAPEIIMATVQSPEEVTVTSAPGASCRTGTRTRLFHWSGTA